MLFGRCRYSLSSVIDGRTLSTPLLGFGGDWNESIPGKTSFYTKENALILLHLLIQIAAKTKPKI